jgi:hypothetical protein
VSRRLARQADGGELSYDEVLEYDRALRLALGAVPPVTEPLEDTCETRRLPPTSHVNDPC